MDEITRKRLRQKGPSQSWTPKEALQRAIDDIDTGAEKPTRAIIILIGESPDGDGMSIAPYRVNVSRVEEVGYLELYKSIALDRWKGDRE